MEGASSHFRDCNRRDCSQSGPNCLNIMYFNAQSLCQNSINALECQSYISRVLAVILALQKPMEIPNTRLYSHAVLVITALAVYNPYYTEQSLQISSFASNICLLTALKLTVFRY